MHKQLAGEDATYECLLSNLWQYRSRFIPMQGTSPDKLYELHDLGVVPEIIYPDSDKLGKELKDVNDLFPECLICGDDWTWHPDEGYPIRKAVLPFAEQYGFEVKSERGTWLLEPS
jgi:hypothetical protein